MKKKKHGGLKFLVLLIFIGGIVYLYGTYFETSNFKTRDFKIESEKITDNFEGFTITHLSDLHYGKYLNQKDLKKIIRLINSTNPDIVVITGDILDKNIKMTTNKSAELIEELSKIKAESGKYVINGDEDYKFDEWDNIINNSNFINLNNSYDTVYNHTGEAILIAGVSTFKDKESISNKLQKADEYLSSFEKNGPVYNVLLMHEPDYIDDLKDNKYDLVLAGHSLAGQIRLPWVGGLIKKDGATKYTDEHYKIKNSELYISNGLGESSINFRLFNSPSFNVYRLVKKN